MKNEIVLNNQSINNFYEIMIIWISYIWTATSGAHDLVAAKIK